MNYDKQIKMVSSQKGTIVEDLLLSIVTILICLSFFGAMINSFISNLEISIYQIQAIKLAQISLEELKIKAYTDIELNEKICKIDERYLAKNYSFDKFLNYSLDIYVSDISNLSKNYANYTKGIVKKVTFIVKYKYKNNEYKTELSTVITKKSDQTQTTAN